MKEKMAESFRDLIWSVLNGDDLDKWMQVRDSTSPDLQGFLDVYDGLVSRTRTQILTLIREEIEKVENPADKKSELYEVFTMGFEDFRQKILKALEAE